MLRYILNLSLVFCLLLSSCGGGKKEITVKKGSPLEKGLTALRREDYKEAVNYLEKAISAEPGNWRASTGLADAYAELENKEKAKSNYQRSISILLKKEEENRGFEELLALGKSNAYLEKFQKGQFYYRKALEKKPDDYEAIYGAGYCKFKLELYKQALPFFKKCYQVKPQDRKLTYYLARSMQKTERGVSKKILDLYEKSASSHQKNSMLQLAKIYQANEYTNRAIDQFRKYQMEGGKLDKTTLKWLEEKEKPEEAKSSSEKTGKKAPQKEKLMICPRCGRLGEKGAEICEFDGESLVPMDN